jgi:nitrite reductase/ring-hydroxylating ferredoxin subunit
VNEVIQAASELQSACQAHGWRYDVTTGSTLNSPGYGVTSYPAKVVDGKILVAV